MPSHALSLPERPPATQNPGPHWPWGPVLATAAALSILLLASPLLIH
jgi:hypothetical protein